MSIGSVDNSKNGEHMWRAYNVGLGGREGVVYLTTVHVHAALVLLYWALAFWAGLGVGQDPVQILALRAVFANPVRHRHAVHLPHP